MSAPFMEPPVHKGDAHLCMLEDPVCPLDSPCCDLSGNEQKSPVSQKLRHILGGMDDGAEGWGWGGVWKAK